MSRIPTSLFPSLHHRQNQHAQNVRIFQNHYTTPLLQFALFKQRLIQFFNFANGLHLNLVPPEIQAFYIVF